MAQVTDKENEQEQEQEQETDVVSGKNYTSVRTRYVELFLNGCDLRRQVK